MGWGSAIGGIAGALGGLVGGVMDNRFNQGMSQADRDFQREVYQNQIQWKAADARKAGLHPLAVIGSGSYSASPSSVPSSNFAASLGKLGEGIGDAFAAYKNKEQIAKEAAWLDEQRQMERDEHDARMRESASKTLMNNGLALEATRRAESYTKPWATGREVVPGQVDAPSIQPKFQRFLNPDGSISDWYPGNDYQEIHSDLPFLEFKPHIEASYWNHREYLSQVPRNQRGYRPDPTRPWIRLR